MQQDSVRGETNQYDVLDIPLSKPLSSNEDCQIQRIRKSLRILNGLVLVTWLHVISIVVLGVLIVLFFQLGWLLFTRNFDSYSDYVLILPMISVACTIYYIIREFVLKLGYKLRQIIDINEKLINQEI